MCKYAHEADKAKPDFDCDTLTVKDARVDESGIDVSKITNRILADDIKKKAVL